jgi:hypothetical protein
VEPTCSAAAASIEKQVLAARAGRRGPYNPGHGVEKLPNLHRILGAALTMIFVGLVVLTVLHVIPILEPTPEEEPFHETAAFVGSGIVLIMITIVVSILRPKVQVRRPEQPAAKYWAQPHVATRVQTMWFLLDGAATLAAVTFAMTGHHAAAAVYTLAVVVFWWMGPNRFAGSSHIQRL